MLSLLFVVQTSAAQTGANTKTNKIDQGPSTGEAAKSAKKACSRGDYEKGVAILADLYVEKNEPVWVFNQGRCYQQNNRFEEALARFREYLRIKPRMSASESSAVETYIAECERELARRAGHTAAPETSAAPSATPPQPAVLPPTPIETGAVVANVSPPEASPAAESSPPPAPESGHGLRLAGIITAVAGLALIGGGVVFNIAANKADDKVRDGDADKVSTRNRYETLGWVGYGVGAAALATGTVLFVLSFRSDNTDRPRLSLLPTLGQGRASLVFEGAF